MTSPSISLKAKRMTTRHLRPASGGWRHVTSAQTPNEHVPVTFALITANDRNRCSVKPNYDWLDPLNGARRQPTTRFSHTPKNIYIYIDIDIFFLRNEISAKASRECTYATFAQQNGYASHDPSANEYFVRLPRPTFGTDDRSAETHYQTSKHWSIDRLRDPRLSFGHQEGSQLSCKLAKHAPLLRLNFNKKASHERTYATFTQQNGYALHDLSVNEYYVRRPRPIFGKDDRSTETRYQTSKRYTIDRSTDCETTAFHLVTERVHSSIAS